MRSDEELAEDRRAEDNQSRDDNTDALNKNTASMDAPDTNGTLIEAVKDLTVVVKSLQTTMRDYPNRNELKRDYASRNEIKRRRYQIGFAMVGAIVAPYFTTVGTVNYCFLNGIPKDGERSVCLVFPGYEEFFDNNRRFVKIVGELQKEVARNQSDLAELKGNS